MQIQRTLLRQKSSATDKVLFGTHLTILGAFVAFVAYLAVACHHVH